MRVDLALIWLIAGSAACVLSCVALRRAKENEAGPLAKRVAAGVLRRRWIVAGAGVVVMVAAGLGASRLGLRTDPIVELPENSPMYQDLRTHERYMSGLVMVVARDPEKKKPGVGASTEGGGEAPARNSFECLDTLSRRLPASVVPQDEDFDAAQKYSLYLLSPDEAKVLDQSVRALQEGGILGARNAATFLNEYGKALHESALIAISEGFGSDEDAAIEMAQGRVRELEAFVGALKGQATGERVRDLYPVESLVLSGRAAEWARGRGFILPYEKGHVMNLRVTHPNALDAEQNREMVKELRAVMAPLEAEGDGAGAEGVRGCRFDLAGIAVNAGESYDVIWNDLSKAVSAILVISIVLIWLFLPRTSLAVTTLLGTTVPVVISAALLYLLFGYVTIGAAVVFPVLLGVGDDLVYHVAARVGVVGRSRDEKYLGPWNAWCYTMSRRLGVEGVVKRLLTSLPFRILAGSWLGRLTGLGRMFRPDRWTMDALEPKETAEARKKETMGGMAEALAELVQPTVWAGTLFSTGGLCILAAHFLGSELTSLKQMGFMLSVGSAVSVVWGLTWMPAAFAVLPAEARTPKASLRAHVVGLMLDRVGELSYQAVRRPWIPVGLVALAAAVAVVPLKDLRRELNVNRVVPEVRGFKFIQELAGELGFWPVPAVIESEKGAAIQGGAGVARVDSFDVLFQGASGDASISKIHANIETQLAAGGARPSTARRGPSIEDGIERFAEALGLMRTTLQGQKMLDEADRVIALADEMRGLKDLTVDPAVVERLDGMLVPGVVRLRKVMGSMSKEPPRIEEFGRYWEKSTGKGRTFVYGKEAVLFDKEPDRLEAWTKELGQYGHAVPLEEGTAWAMRTAGIAFDVAFPAMLAVTFFLSWLASHSAKKALLVIALPVLGSLFAAGGVSAVGLRVDFANQWVWVLLVGLGVDDVVHLLHVGPRRIQPVIRPLAITSATTVISGLVLMFSRTEGYRTFGWAYFFGIGSMAFMSLFVVPSAMELMERRRVRKEAANGANGVGSAVPEAGGGG